MVWGTRWFSGIFSWQWILVSAIILLCLAKTTIHLYFFLFVCFLFSGDHLSASASRHHLPCSPAALLELVNAIFHIPSFLLFPSSFSFFPLFSSFSFLASTIFVLHLCFTSAGRCHPLCLLSVTLQSSSLFQREVSKHVCAQRFHAWWISFFSYQNTPFDWWNWIPGGLIFLGSMDGNNNWESVIGRLHTQGTVQISDWKTSQYNIWKYLCTQHRNSQIHNTNIHKLAVGRWYSNNSKEF